MTFNNAYITKCGPIVVAHGRFTMKETVTDVNPLMHFSIRPKEYATPLMSYGGAMVTGNVWLNTKGDIGIWSNVELKSGESGVFSCVYLAR